MYMEVMSDKSVVPDDAIEIQQMEYHVIDNFVADDPIEVPANAVGFLGFDFTTILLVSFVQVLSRTQSSINHDTRFLTHRLTNLHQIICTMQTLTELV